MNFYVGSAELKSKYEQLLGFAPQFRNHIVCVCLQVLQQKHMYRSLHSEPPASSDKQHHWVLVNHNIIHNYYYYIYSHNQNNGWSYIYAIAHSSNRISSVSCFVWKCLFCLRVYFDNSSYWGPTVKLLPSVLYWGGPPLPLHSAWIVCLRNETLVTTNCYIVPQSTTKSCVSTNTRIVD